MSVGWRFATPDDNVPGDNVTPDPIHGFAHLRDIYFKINPDYEGRFTVPTLYDVKQGKIVSNEVWLSYIRRICPAFPEDQELKIANIRYYPFSVQRDHPHVLHRIR